MSFQVETHCKAEFECNLSLEKTRTFFSDYPNAIGKQFYGLKEFTPLPDHSYRWIFNKLAYKSYELQIQFSTTFVPEGKNRIAIVPVKNGDKASLSGYWEFKEQGGKTQIHFEACLIGELPLPGLLKSMVAPLAQQEVKKIFDRYIANVKKTLGA